MSVTVVLDNPTAPILARAYRHGRLCAYAIADLYGWAIVARVRRPPQGRRAASTAMTTIDRYTPLWPGDTSRDLAEAAIHGLARFATTGSTATDWESRQTGATQ